MSDDLRLDNVLTAARAQTLAVGCPDHQPLFDRLADPHHAVDPADFDALADSVDCPACVAVLAAHPFLDSELLDLPMPRPQLPDQAPSRVWRVAAVLALAAALLLAALSSAPGPADPLPKPGPLHTGHASYAFVDPANPLGPGHSLYGWVRRPLTERYEFEAPESSEQKPQIAANYRYNPWLWR